MHKLEKTRNFQINFKALKKPEILRLANFHEKLTMLKNKIFLKKIKPKNNLSKIKLEVFWIESCVH